MADRVNVAIAVPLEEELVDSIGAVDPRVELVHHPELLPPTRYPNDHRGIDGFRRTGQDERRWQQMIRRAEVLFGVPGDSPQGPGRSRWRRPSAALDPGHLGRGRGAGGGGGATLR
jgi:hypothetical protein